MSSDLLPLIRNILLRTFAITYGLTILMALATFGLWDTWTALITQWFHTTPAALSSLMLTFFTAVKFYAIFILLAPALALHWTIKVRRRKEPDSLVQ